MKKWIANSTDNEWKIKSTKPKESRNIRCLIKEKAVKQIKSLCHEYEELEWIAGLEGEIREKEIIITNIKLFEQEVQGAFCEFTNDGSEEMAKSKCIGWIHSHNKMGVFFSGQDEETCKFNKVSIVVNNDLNAVGKYRMRILETVDAYADLDIFYETKNQIDLKKLKEELTEKINKSLEKKKVTIKELELEIEEEYDEEYIEEAKKLITKKYTTSQTQVSSYHGTGSKNKVWFDDYEDEEDILTFEDLSEEEKESLKGQECVDCSNKIKLKNIIVYKDEPYHKKCFSEKYECLREEKIDKEDADEWEYCTICQNYKKHCVCEVPHYMHY